MSNVGLVISDLMPFEKGFKVELTGAINLYSSGTLNAAVLKKTTPGMRLALDLTKVPIIDSSGIGFIIRLARDLEKKGGRLVACGITEDFRKNLQALKVDSIVRLAPSPAEIPKDFWD